MELVACVTSFIFWKRLRSSQWKFFPLYLALIVIFELVAHHSGDRTNQFIGVFILMPLQYFFWYAMFYAWFKNTRYRYWPAAAAAVYLAVASAEVIWPGYLNRWIRVAALSYTTGALLLLVLLILFFVRLSLSSDILYYRGNLMFWVCAGLLLFYLGSLPFYALRYSIFRYSKSFYFGYWKAIMALNYSMYALFTLGIIWSRKK